MGGGWVYFNLKILRGLLEVDEGGFGRFFARSGFRLGVKFYFSARCYWFRSKEVNKRAIRTVATTNLKLGGWPRFWFRRVWMRLETLSKCLARRA